jgi:hypothetical protein
MKTEPIGTMNLVVVLDDDQTKVAGISEGVIMLTFTAVIEDGKLRESPKVELRALQQNQHIVWLHEPLSFNTIVKCYFSQGMAPDVPVFRAPVDECKDEKAKENYCKQLASELGYLLVRPRQNGESGQLA